ncbi:hypothetical protein OGAPHI_006270 [Ogataea philodendri]|uniref:DNA repair protein rhp7 treble clef domain-containing protein n=1 Tax=Ogataea philodendri TaxID=1378263 RepID=A0A9P8T1E9_9ASCO|nr:uncharacterized protein OGAPHI_006270 [Ogataea philodendri]KAH3662089.1 hypothetical protein OGAPHI_006270 [Ogataea philodendri]
MSRRRGRQTETGEEFQVQGPSSALTSFLREQGISAEAIRTRYEEGLRRQLEEEAGGEEVENGGSDESDEEILEGEEETAEIKRIRERARAKRRRAQREDGLDDDEKADGNNFCIECDREFVISVYSKRIEKYGRIGYLCPECTTNEIKRQRLTKRNEIEARKRRKKVAAALLDKQEFKIPTLQDCCINVISKNIDAVDLLGDIGVVNMKKIGRILSKNRSLDNRTMALFLDPAMREIEFWDCSNIDSVALNKIAAFCPNVERLVLNMCGRLHKDNLNYYAQKFTNLQYIYLNGAFLINDQTWQDFFDSPVGKNLKGVHIKNTHRFTPDSLISLLDNCGNNLEELTLSRLDGLTSKSVYDLLPHYLRSLKHLEISYPNKEELIDDELIINLMGVNGESLETLILDGCSGLTDTFLVSGVKPFCPALTKLSLVMLDQITDSGVSSLFNDWAINGGLMDVNLSRCIDLGDDGVYAVLEHSCQTLVELNLNSVKNISRGLFKQIGRNLRFPLLTALDLGFVRSCDDSALAVISRIAPKLTILEVYGDNRCTSAAIVRDNLRIIGRQSDSI